MEFKYDIGWKVRLRLSDEEGDVVGRAQYQHGENSYLVRYRAADGCQRQSWFEESAIV